MAKQKTRRVNRNNILLKKKGTLDQKHTEKINKFQKLTNSLPHKKEKLNSMEKELVKLKKINPSECSREDIRRKALLMDMIEKLKREINSIENDSESLNYISDTLPILIDYYNNDNKFDAGMEEEFVEEMHELKGKKNILTYFVKENKKNLSEEQNSNIQKRKKSGNKIDPKKKQRLTKAELYDNYLSIVDVNYRKSSDIKNKICSQENCGGEMVPCQTDGVRVCRKCGISIKDLFPVEKPNYKEPVQDSGTYAYKRINHLTEILSQLQAKESTDIPKEVFELILQELKKRKIKKDHLDIFRLRKILKKLGLRKYYEHVPHILQIINGKEPPNFSRRDELQIKRMFKDIQKPFAIYCPKNRKNFLNYSYVLHKFCELLGLDEYVGYFPLLKNNAKLLQHDRIWKNICRYMKWEYYKSI